MTVHATAARPNATHYVITETRGNRDGSLTRAVVVLTRAETHALIERKTINAWWTVTRSDDTGMVLEGHCAGDTLTVTLPVSLVKLCKYCPAPVAGRVRATDGRGGHFTIPMCDRHGRPFLAEQAAARAAYAARTAVAR